MDVKVPDQTPHQIYANAIKAGMKGSGLDLSAHWFTKMLKRSARNIIKGGSRGYTKWASNWTYDYDYKDGDLLFISVHYIEARVVLIPTKVTTILKNHEDGHVLIRRLAVKQLKMDIENIGAKATNKTFKKIIDLIRATIKETSEIGRTASKQFDNVTNHARVGGEDQQIIAKIVWEETLKEAR